MISELKLKPVSEEFVKDIVQRISFQTKHLLEKFCLRCYEWVFTFQHLTNCINEGIKIQQIPRLFKVMQHSACLLGHS